MAEESLELARKCELWFAAVLIGIMVVSPIVLISRFDSGRALYFAEREQFAETTTGSISRLITLTAALTSALSVEGTTGWFIGIARIT